jgi:RNA polymerase sigma-70 factor (ECF subfamily)
MDIDLQACVNGDKGAWDALVVRYSGLILTAVRRALHGAGDAEVDDIVQEVFLRLLKDDRRTLRSYNPALASLSTWLTLVARSVTIDRLRRRGHQALALDDADLPAPAAPPAHSEPPDPSTAGSIPLHILTARQRLVLSMLFDRELSVEEAARVLGVNEQTVRSTKHKALTRLREHLAAAGDDDGPAIVEQGRSTT